jgi:hypothetical protein
MASLPDIEVVAAEVHEAWRAEKIAAGVTSRPSGLSGQEQLVPWSDLHEKDKESNRMMIRTVYAAIEKATPCCTKPVIDRINEALSSSPKYPDRKEAGYIFLFRGFLESPTSEALVGVCLAWATPEAGENAPSLPSYYCVAGSDKPSAYRRGEMIDACVGGLPHRDDLLREDAMEYFRAAKDKSMAALIAHVRSVRSSADPVVARIRGGEYKAGETFTSEIL